MSGADRQAALDAIYAAAAMPERWPDAIAVMSDHLGASGGMIAYYPPEIDRRFLVTGRLRDDLLPVFAQHYATNHWTEALRKLQFGEPVLINSIADETALRRSAFYADILATQNIEDMIATPHPSLWATGGSGGFSFMLNSRQRENAPAIKRRLQPLIPHVKRAIDLSLDLGRHLASSSTLEQTLQATPGAALLLDHRGRISFANVAAESLLAESHGLSVQKSDPLRLAASDDREDRALNRAIGTSIALALRRGEDWTGTVRISRPSDRPSLLIHVTPLLGPFHPFGPAILSTACVLVQVLGGLRQRMRLAETLRRLYGLTTAEARVAVLIAQGLAVPAAARALQVSITTVRTHLNQCFEKMEIRSQVDLARIVATVPFQGSIRTSR